MKLVHIVLAVLLMPLLEAQEPVAKPVQLPQSETLRIKLKYYVCVDPMTDPVCVATKKSDDKCDRCKKWREESYAGEKVIDADIKYEPANKFISDALESTYGVPADVALPTTADIYLNPAEFGLLELPDDENKEGSIVMWKGMAGIATDGDPVEMIYPSASKEAVTSGRVAGITNRGEPKFLFPEAVLQQDAEAKLAKEEDRK